MGINSYNSRMTSNLYRDGLKSGSVSRNLGSAFYPISALV